MNPKQTSQRAAEVAIALNVVNTVLSVVLYCIPLNSGDASQSVVEEWRGRSSGGPP